MKAHFVQLAATTFGGFLQTRYLVPTLEWAVTVRILNDLDYLIQGPSCQGNARYKVDGRIVQLHDDCFPPLQYIWSISLAVPYRRVTASFLITCHFRPNVSKLIPKQLSFWRVAAPRKRKSRKSSATARVEYLWRRVNCDTLHVLIFPALPPIGS